MKKLIALLLLLALVPAAVIADATDPIVGSWYAYFDGDVNPELLPLFDGVEKDVTFYTFLSSGTIIGSETKITGTNGTAQVQIVGKWSVSGGEYNVSIIGYGEGRAYLSDDGLLIPVGNGLMARIRKLVPINPYQDYTPQR